MKWIPQDIELYLKSKEYIDTAVIPLIPITFGEDMKHAASMAEFINLASALLERQFTGRILLLPPFTYLSVEDQEKKLADLGAWVSALKDNQIKHIFFLTSDSEWKMHDQNLESLIWIPALPLENLEDSQKKPLVDSQVKQILTLFTKKWHDYEEA